jgi:hypothetical protein
MGPVTGRSWIPAITTVTIRVEIGVEERQSTVESSKPGSESDGQSGRDDVYTSVSIARAFIVVACLSGLTACDPGYGFTVRSPEGHRNSDHARDLPIHESVLAQTTHGRRGSSMPETPLNGRS